jgi:hypothetical protein
MPVSTTQTIVGALVGVGFATQASITWGWESGSVSQVAASWAIAPLIACGFSALIFASVKYLVLERKDSFKWGMRLIPFYFALTSAILALFIVVEAPTSPSLEEFGGGRAAGIVLGVFFGILALTYIFFVPFLKRKLIHKDARLRIWHVPLGPLLSRENPPLYWPGKGDEYVKNYYADGYGEVRANGQDLRQRKGAAVNGDDDAGVDNADSITKKTSPNGSNGDIPTDPEKAQALEDQVRDGATIPQLSRQRRPEPYERWIVPAKQLSWVNPLKYWGYLKFSVLQGKYSLQRG